MNRLKLIFRVFVLLFVFVYSSCEKENKGVKIKYTIETSAKEMLQLHCYNNDNLEFTNTIRLTDSLYSQSPDSYIKIFGNSWKENYPDSTLIELFPVSGIYNFNEFITGLNSEYKKNIKETLLIIKKRLEENGNTEIHFKNINNKGIIELEIQGITNPSVVRNLIQNQINIGFYGTYENSELFNLLMEADKIIADSEEFKGLSENKQSNSSEVSLLDSNSDEIEIDINPEDAQFIKEHPLIVLLKLNIQQNITGETIPVKGPVVGYCFEKDTAEVNKMLKFIRNVKYSPFPRQLEFVWSTKPFSEEENLFQLVALKLGYDNLPELDGKNIVNANSQNTNGYNEIGLEMNSEGAKIFQNLTKENIGKSIAIVINGSVHSFPIVNAEIEGGKCTISGNFEEDEAAEMAVLFKSGLMPLNIRIVGETIIN